MYTKNLLTVKNAILAVFGVNNVFLCIFKNTDQNNICVSIVLKAKAKKKFGKKLVDPKKVIFEF